MIGEILGFISKPITQYIKNKGEEKQAVHTRKMKQIEGEQDWDTTQAKASQDSWKDEYLTIVITSPFILSGIAVLFDLPEMMLRIESMFDILDKKVPDEYWLLFSVAVAASFGVKGIINGISKLRGG